MRVVAAPCALLFVLIGALLLPSSPAGAQNDLVTSQPEDGAVIQESPGELVLTFAETVGNVNNVTVSCEGQPFTDISQPVVSDDSRTLTVDVREPFPRGTCTVVWAVSQDDGRPGADGSFSFSVETGAAPETTPPEDELEPDDPEPDESPDDPESDDPDDNDDNDAPTTPDEEAEREVPGGEQDDTDEAAIGAIGSEGSAGPLWAGRMLSTVGMAVVLGALVVIAMAWPEGPEYVIAVRFIRSAWIVAVAGTVVFVAAATASATGDSFGSSLSPLAWGDLVDVGWPGRAALARLLLVLATGWVVALPERVVQPSTQLAGVGLPLLAVATLGLTRTGGDLAALGVAMGMLHVVAMAVWLGGAVFVSRIVLAGSGGDDLVHATRGFGKVAMPALVVTVLTGLVQLFRLDGGNLFSEPHGRVLLLKTVVVAGVLFIAVSTQQAVQARLTRARSMDPRVAGRLRRAFGVNAGLGVVVLAITGWMLNYEPGSVDEETVEDEVTAIEELVEDEEADISLSVAIAPGVVGENQIAVRVFEPEDGLSALQVTFVPPAGSDLPAIEQAIPLQGRGIAVLAPNDDGIPFEVAGTWQLQVSASTGTGSISGTQATFEIRNPDGSLPDSRIDQPDDDEGNGDDDGNDNGDENDGDEDEGDDNEEGA